MARLYACLDSDIALNEKTIMGNYTIALRVNYGSKEDSKVAVRIRVEWFKDEEKPRVFVYPISTESVKVCDRF